MKISKWTVLVMERERPPVAIPQFVQFALTAG